MIYTETGGDEELTATLFQKAMESGNNGKGYKQYGG